MSKRTRKTRVLAAIAALAVWGEASAQLTFSESTAKVDGATLYYRIGGSGPYLFMLHGMTGVGHDWDLYIDRLAESYTVVVPDLPGHGKSTNEAGVFQFPGVVTALIGLADHVGAERFGAVGFSVGGVSLLHLARRAPDRLEAMVLVAAGHRVSAARREALRIAPSFEELSSEDREWHLTHHAGGEAQTRTLLAQRRAMAENYIDLTGEDLAGIATPTLLVWGEDDEPFPLPIPFELQRGLPTADLWIVDGVGHTLLWPEWGGSERVVRVLPSLIVRFLKENGYE